MGEFEGRVVGLSSMKKVGLNSHGEESIEWKNRRMDCSSAFAKIVFRVEIGF